MTSDQRTRCQYDVVLTLNQRCSQLKRLESNEMLILYSYITSQWHITPGILLSTAYSSNLHYLIVHFQYSSFIADNKHSIHPLHLDKLRNSYLNHFMIFAVYKNENISLLFTYLSPYF